MLSKSFKSRSPSCNNTPKQKLTFQISKRSYREMPTARYQPTVVARLSQYTTLYRNDDYYHPGGHVYIIIITSGYKSPSSSSLYHVEDYRYAFHFKDGLLLDANGNFVRNKEDLIMKTEFVNAMKYVCSKFMCRVNTGLEYDPNNGHGYLPLYESYPQMEKEWTEIMKWNNKRLYNYVRQRECKGH